MLKKAVLGVIKEFAGSTLIDTIEPYVNDIKNETINAARDTLESVVTGRRTLDEWAEIVIAGVDKVKDKVIEDNGWKYVGGKLNFAMSEKNANKVVISFDLYFLDEEKNGKRLVLKAMYLHPISLWKHLEI